ncbi:MAG: M20/M25/M40 family metallo-hydrolase [Desulfobacterales bacterium]|jgi:acetylornithine deacetylase
METRIADVLSKLVEIDSVNLTLSNGPGEIEIAEFIARYLENLGFDAEIQAIAPRRANVVAIIPGKNKKPGLLLNGHLDTVGVEEMSNPFKLKAEGDRLYGRGTYDMKGSLAVMLLIAEDYSKQPPPIDILLTFAADEEDKSLGMEYIVKKWLPTLHSQPSGAIFLEPTELEIGICHKGFTWYEIDIIGQAAHGSRPAEGIDAILPLQAALAELKNIETELSHRQIDPLLGPATLHASLVKGGSELSMIPARSKLQWERRTLPEESSESLKNELMRVIAAVANFQGHHQVTGRESFVRHPYRIPEDANIVKKLKAASPNSQFTGLSFWADSALCGLAGIPSVLFGPLGHGAHAADEWVSLKSLVKVYDVLKQVILTF